MYARISTGLLILLFATACGVPAVPAVEAEDVTASTTPPALTVIPETQSQPAAERVFTPTPAQGAQATPEDSVPEGRTIEPPPAVLSIDGVDQSAGIGSYCWINQGQGVCADAVGIITPQTPLAASRGRNAHLRLPLMATPLELQLEMMPVTDKDVVADVRASFRAWKFPSKTILSPLTLVPEQDFRLPSKPGLYVLHVAARWDEPGGVSYGFLVRIE